MKHLIRTCDSHAFLAVSGGWTKDPQRALPFSEATAAISAANRFHLKGVELYHFYDECENSTWDFAVPLQAPRSQERTLVVR